MKYDCAAVASTLATEPRTYIKTKWHTKHGGAIKRQLNLLKMSKKTYMKQAVKLQVSGCGCNSGVLLSQQVKRSPQGSLGSSQSSGSGYYRRQGYCRFPEDTVSLNTMMEAVTFALEEPRGTYHRESDCFKLSPSCQAHQEKFCMFIVRIILKALNIGSI